MPWGTRRTRRNTSPAWTRLWPTWTNGRPFDDFSSEIEEYIEAGTHVVAVTRWRATGKRTAMNVDQRTFDVFEFSGGKIVRITFGYSDKADALKAVGLEE